MSSAGSPEARRGGNDPRATAPTKSRGKQTGRLLGEITGRFSLPPSRCKTAAIRVKPSRPHHRGDLAAPFAGVCADNGYLKNYGKWPVYSILMSEDRVIRLLVVEDNRLYLHLVQSAFRERQEKTR